MIIFPHPEAGSWFMVVEAGMVARGWTLEAGKVDLFV
jgi:hypothetical protein